MRRWGCWILHWRLFYLYIQNSSLCIMWSKNISQQFECFSMICRFRSFVSLSERLLKELVGCLKWIRQLLWPFSLTLQQNSLDVGQHVKLVTVNLPSSLLSSEHWTPLSYEQIVCWTSLFHAVSDEQAPVCPCQSIVQPGQSRSSSDTDTRPVLIFRIRSRDVTCNKTKHEKTKYQRCNYSEYREWK